MSLIRHIPIVTRGSIVKGLPASTSCDSYVSGDNIYRGRKEKQKMLNMTTVYVMCAALAVALKWIDNNFPRD